MRFSLKTVLLTALLVTLPAMVAGQSALGIRGGLSIASFGGDDAEDLDSKTGLSISGFFDVPLSGIIGFQVGAGFVQKGFTETELGIDVELKLGYIEVPLLLTLSPTTSGNVGFDFFVGPSFGFNTGCDLSVTDDSTTLTFECDDPSLDIDIKSYEVGAMVGAGLNLALTENASLVLDVFYNLGLTKIDDSGAADDDVKNRAFSILVGASFPLGG